MSRLPASSSACLQMQPSCSRSNWLSGLLAWLLLLLLLKCAWLLLWCHHGRGMTSVHHLLPPHPLKAKGDLDSWAGREGASCPSSHPFFPIVLFFQLPHIAIAESPVSQSSAHGFCLLHPAPSLCTPWEVQLIVLYSVLAGDKCPWIARDKREGEECQWTSGREGKSVEGQPSRNAHCGLAAVGALGWSGHGQVAMNNCLIPVLEMTFSFHFGDSIWLNMLIQFIFIWWFYSLLNTFFNTLLGTIPIFPLIHRDFNSFQPPWTFLCHWTFCDPSILPVKLSVNSFWPSSPCLLLCSAPTEETEQPLGKLRGATEVQNILLILIY